MQFSARSVVVVAPKLDRYLPDTFDGLENRLALLLANGVAQEAAQHPDVLAQGQITFGKIDHVHSDSGFRGALRYPICRRECVRSVLHPRWVT